MLAPEVNNNDYPPRGLERLPPPNFPENHLHYCARIRTRILNENNQLIIPDGDSLVPTGGLATFNNAGGLDASDDVSMSDSSSSTDSSPREHEIERDATPKRAYLLLRTLSDAIHGRVWYGRVLTRNSPQEEWRMTAEECAIKEMSWESIRRGRENQLAEDPQIEISVMRYLKQYHASFTQHGGQISAQQAMIDTNIMMPLDFFYDQTFVYSIMPFCNGGDLFGALEQRRSFTEPEARFIIKQILDGLEWLQRAGLCHRDMSLENLMIDNNGNVFIIDMGMCIRIPYEGNNDQLRLTEDHRTRNRRLTFGGRCGKLYYMSPEIYGMRHFDGHAVDLWAVGVILVMLLTGNAPWERPVNTDEYFHHMSTNANLTITMRDHWNLNLSAEAFDLMQRMLNPDPRERLSLNQIRAHPWMDMNLLMVNPAG